MSNMLSYKGYHATIEYDADDGLLVGTVFGIRDTLVFHGTSIPEIAETFHDCIDTYLQVCEEQGISPDKEFKGSLNIRISPDLHRKAALMAEKEGISLNQLIQQAIEGHVQPDRYKTIVVQLPLLQGSSTVRTTGGTGYSDRYRSKPSRMFQ